MIADDGLGTNELTVSGDDAAAFEIRPEGGGQALYFIGGSPNYETQDIYSVRVEVNDPDVGGDPDAYKDITLHINDLQENTPPTGVTAVGGNLVGNGGFEAGLASWIAAGSVGSYGGARQSEGSLFAVFNGFGLGSGGTLSQTIATEVGKTYVLSFEAGAYGSGNSANSLGVKVLSNGVSLVDTTVQDPIPSNGSSATVYDPYTFTFTATDSHDDYPLQRSL